MRRFLLKLFRRKRLHEDLETELAFHREMAGQRLNPIPLGNTGLIKEQALDLWRFRLIEDLWRDLLYAAKALRQAPLFSAAAIVTLGLGIGANTFVFTFIEDFILRSLPVSDPQGLVSLNWVGNANFSYPDYLDFRDRNQVFSQLVASRINIVNVSLRTRDNLLSWGYEATGNYFQTLGLRPQLGRFFTANEDGALGAHPVVVISDHYWRTYFDGAREVLGRTIKLNGYPFTVIGVAPPSFTGTELIVACDFWVPMSMAMEIEPGNDWYHSRAAMTVWLMGRLKPGVSNAEARVNLDAIGKQIARQYPDHVGVRARFRLVRPGLVGENLRTPLTGFAAVLAGLAALVLLLACVNLAGMLLARASDRQREIGIRLALGASRWRLVRQFMTESALLGVVGGAAGFGIAAGACHVFGLWLPDFGAPLNATLHPDAAVLGFTMVVALLTTVVFGLTPALQSTGTDILPRLKEDIVAARFRKVQTRDVLLVGQIALSVLLVICSALVVRSLQNALSVRLGYDPERAVSVSFDLRLRDYSEEKSRQFTNTLLERARAIPGFDAVGVTNNMPLRLDHGSNLPISRADRALPRISDRQGASIYNISSGYLAAMGTRLLAGRNFDGRDREGAPSVVIVNEALIHAFFPGENPLGQRVRLSFDAADKGLTIIGVVETGKYGYLGEDPHPAVFRPIAQTGVDWTTVVARGPLPAAAATELLRKTVLDLNPELALSNVGSLRDQLALPLFPARIAAILLGLFGFLALVLAATGLFALVAYTVARRSREIGIRMALGAERGQVLAVVFRRTMVLCMVGLALGVAMTLFGGQMLSIVLYGVSPHDPAAFGAAILVMIGVAGLACWEPAMRAIRTDPARTLREE